MQHARILIVADEAVTSQEIACRLRSLGFQVAGQAATVSEALALAAEQRPDLALMDVRLGAAIDGPDAARLMRERLRVPVVLLGAQEDDATIEQAMLARPSGYVAKPFESRTLKAVIEMALCRHGAEQELQRLNRLHNVLIQINEMIVRTATRSELLSAVCHLAAEYGQFRMVWIGWRDEATNTIEPVAHRGADGGYLGRLRVSAADEPHGQGPAGVAVREGRTSVSNDALNDPRMSPWREAAVELGIGAVAAVPLRFQGRVCGALSVCAAEPRFFQEKEIDLLEKVGLDVSYALDNLDREARRKEAEAALRLRNEELQHEIAERRKAQQSVTESERQLATLLANLPGMAYRCQNQPTWPMEFVSEGCAALTGWPQRALLENRPAYGEIIVLEDRETVWATVEAALEQKQAFEMTYRIRAAGGEVRWVWERGRGVFDDGGQLLFLEGFITDITQRKHSEEGLRESEQRFRRLIEASPMPILVIRDHRVDYANLAACRLIGVDHQEGLQGTEVLDLVAPECRDQVSRYMEARRRKEPAPENYRAIGLRRDGTRFPYEISVAQIDVPNGPVTLAYVNDITERARAEEAVQSAHQRLLDTIESLPDATFVLDQSKRVTAWNRACEQLTGVKAEAIVGQGEFACALPFYGKRRPMLIDLLELSAPEVEAQYKYIKREGDRLYAEAFAPLLNQGRGAHLWGVATPLFDHGGRRFGAVEVIRDVTERKQAEDQIRQQAALLEATRDAIIVWDLERGVRFMNRPAETLTGHSLQAALGKDLSQVLPLRSELALRAALQEVKAHGLWTGGLTLRPAGGTERELDTRWSLVADDNGKPKSILLTCNDVTEKKRLEAQYLRAQRLESVGTLASGVAHDLNNILSPILMGLGVLGMNAKDEETRGILAMMMDSARRGSDTVKQLLTFARGAESQHGPVQPRHLVKEIAKLMGQTFPKNIQIYTDFASEPRTVLADPSQLHQVLMNLCVNARDAMPEGGVLFLTIENRTLDEATARIHPKARPIPYVLFKIADNGTGIPPEILDRIFDPFFTTKPQGKGTGLGLATVLGIVESHHGFVLVESQPGRGTTFQVYIPAGKTIEPAGEPELVQAPQGHGELILVVDDEPAILRMVDQVLRHSGYRTLTAAGASEAVQLYERNQDRVQAVITDVMMPFGDGRHLIGLLFAQNPKLPVVAMSGLGTDEFQRETARRGACGFLRKPFSAEALLKALHAALNGAPAGPV